MSRRRQISSHSAVVLPASPCLRTSKYASALAVRAAALANLGSCPQLRPADLLEEGECLGVRVRAHGDVPVAGRQRPVVRAEQASVTGRAHRRQEGCGSHVLGGDEARHVLEHRNLDRLPPSGALAPVEREADRLGGDQPGDVVGHHHGNEPRLAGGAVQCCRNAGDTLDHRVVGRRVVVAPALAEPDDHAVDEPRIDVAETRRVETGALQPPGAHVGHEHVGARDQPAHGVEPVRMLEIQTDRALVAVEVQELARHPWRPAAVGHGPQQVAAG